MSAIAEIGNSEKYLYFGRSRHSSREVRGPHLKREKSSNIPFSGELQLLQANFIVFEEKSSLDPLIISVSFCLFQQRMSEPTITIQWISTLV